MMKGEWGVLCLKQPEGKGWVAVLDRCLDPSGCMSRFGYSWDAGGCYNAGAIVTA